MSFTSSQKAKFLAGSTDMSSVLTRVTANTDVEMLDDTTLADSAKSFLAGLGSGKLSGEGWFDSTAISALFTNLDFFEALGLAYPMTYGPAGLSVGSNVTLAGARRESFETGTPVGGVTNFSFNITGDGAVAPGWALHALSAETADANGTTVDRGADMTSSTNGAVAHLHMTAFSGFSSVSVIVEDSANNSAWATIGTFSSLSSTGAQRLLISGTVRRYVRCSWDVTGTGSATFSAAVAAL